MRGVGPRNHVFDEREYWRHLANAIKRLCAAAMNEYATCRRRGLSPNYFWAILLLLLQLELQCVALSACRVIVSVLTVADTDCRLIEIGNVAHATGGHVRSTRPAFLAVFTTELEMRGKA